MKKDDKGKNVNFLGVHETKYDIKASLEILVAYLHQVRRLNTYTISVVFALFRT